LNGASCLQIGPKIHAAEQFTLTWIKLNYVGLGASRLYDIRTAGNACVNATSKHVLRGPIRVLDGDTVVVADERVRLLGKITLN
jgi:endonuclease YncB( thermonuclease family)